MRHRHLKYLACLPAAIIMISIFYFSAQPHKQSSDLSSGFIMKSIFAIEQIGHFQWSEEEKLQLVEKLQTPVRKAAHMSEYALLGAAVGWPLFLCGFHKRRGVFYGEIICAFYAATDEFHQLFVSGRAGRISDVLIDSAGALIGCILIGVILNRVYKST